MDDLLKQSAIAYTDLMRYEYRFTLGHKGKQYSLNIAFPVSAYHHLAAFHKAGFKALENKSKALQAILEEKVTAQNFEEAGYLFSDRWVCICGLQAMIEDNRTVFRYRGHERTISRIEADYFLQDDHIAFFVAEGCPISIFSQKGQHYEKNCPRLTTLLIMREDINTGASTEIYRAKAYKE